MYFCTFDIEMKISDVMKVYTFLVLAVSAILTSCQMHEDLEPVLNHDVLYAAIDDFEPTRTVMDKSNLFWTEGDQIVAFMKSSKGLKYQISASSAGSNSAVFENVSGMNPSPGTRIVHNIAYYPYGSKVAVSKLGDNYIVDAVLPADQIYAPHSFGKDSFPMVAVSDNDHFLFKNVCGAIKLQVTGNHKVASVRIEGKNNEKLSGSAVVAIFPDGSVPSFREFCHAKGAARRREEPVLKELTAKKKVVGLKQTRRAVAEGLAQRVYVALDADPLLTEPLMQLCREAGVCITEVRTMKELGRACAIAVGTAAAAIVAK